LIRIIAFAAMSEGSRKSSNQSSVVMKKLIRIGEEKHNNLCPVEKFRKGIFKENT